MSARGFICVALRAQTLFCSVLFRFADVRQADLGSTLRYRRRKLRNAWPAAIVCTVNRLSLSFRTRRPVLLAAGCSFLRFRAYNVLYAYPR